MNRSLHRLVFSRRLGACVAVAETARACGKSASGERRSRGGLRVALAGLLAAPLAVQSQTAPAPPPAPRPAVFFASKLPAPSNPLPQPYATVKNPDGTLRNDPALRQFVANPAHRDQVKWTVDGSKAVLDQGNVQKLILNWDSFDIAAGHSVHFKQDKDPAKYVTALNRIWSADPSVILGRLTADREVILLNSNGVYFGSGAQVDTGKFIATSLSIADAVFEKGLRNITDGSAVFTTAGTDYQATNLDSAVTVEAGAEIRVAAGGDVLLLAPRVVNQGRIDTPKGQAVLAAGDKVYLMSSSDPAQRGLIVAVDPVLKDFQPDAELGTVENAATGSFESRDSTGKLITKLNEIRADSGSINLVGLAVKQNGVLNATTAVKGANGVITLQAMASTQALIGGGPTTPGGLRGYSIETGSSVRAPDRLGRVEIGAGSVTAVTPDASSATQLDAEVFNPSRLRVEGQSIVVDSGARIELPSGRVELLAAENASTSPLFNAGALSAAPDASRIVVGSGATLNVAGLRDVAVDGSRNQGSQRLFRIELADAPVQRDGPLYRSQVFFDVRDAAKIGAANVSGAAAAVRRTAAERSTEGGSLLLGSRGALLIDQGAALDASGGSLKVSEATIANSLVNDGGRLTQFSQLPAGNRIDAVVGEQRLLSPGYTEGKAGGTLSLLANDLLQAGTLRGEVIQGERQRDGRDPRAAAATLEIGRVQASEAALNRVHLGPAASGFSDALRADPLATPLSAMDLGQISLAAVQSAGFGALRLSAQDIRQTAFESLDLGAGGRLEIHANRLQLDGAFQAAGGTISLSTLVASNQDAATRLGDILLSGRTRLDVAGRWTNDSAGASAQVGGQTPLVQNNGGQVTVNAAHSLLAEAGSQVDVSAGARLAGNGSLRQGTAGAISLASGRQELFATTLQIAGVQLSGFDFASGGKLTLGAPSLTLGPGAQGFALAPEFFSQGGFGSITVNAFGDILLRSGLQLQPQLRNWQLSSGSRQVASGAMSDAVVSAVQLDAGLVERKPVHLSLNASRPLPQGGSSLTVERGASVMLDPGATLSLSATRNLSIGEQGGDAHQQSDLSARGGHIQLQLQGQRGAPAGSTNPDPIGFLNDQAIWIGDGARLDVSGIALLRPDASPLTFSGFGTPGEGTRVTGTVLGGGTISMQAARGYVVVEQGSTLKLDGASSELNLPGSTQRATVARSAGTLALRSPEGFVIEGQVSARAPQGADGGKLDLQIGTGGVEAATGGPTFPGFDASGQPQGEPKPRELRLGSNAALSDGLALGDNLFAVLDNGIGHVSARLLTGTGFAGFNLGAGDRIRFASDLTLQAGLSLRLDAPALLGDAGVDVRLSAASVTLGDHTANRIGAAPDRSAKAAGADGATLRIGAAALDIVGLAGLQGFDHTELVADGAAPGAIRFLSRAIDAKGSAGLNFADTLVLSAGQVHAASFTEGLLNGLAAAGPDATGSRLEIRHASQGADRRIPLSAQGGLTFSATTIDQGGTLLQPYGRIALRAERELLLRDGSLTSVSSEGQFRLAGSTTNLGDWRPAFGQSLETLAREPGIELRGQTVNAKAGASVRASGGGDLLANEFFPGVGGSRDYLETEGLYAVLPDFGAGNVLPFDGNGGAVDALQTRQLVVTMGGSGLAPGRYTLLPARYALLAGELPQGAFLVRAASDQGKAQLSAPIRQDDGSTVITAYQTEPGAVAAGLPGERWLVEAPATYRAKAEVRLTRVSQILANVAADAGLRPPTLPGDAGQVQISASGTEPGRWEAALQLAAASGGRAGLLDVSASSLALVDVLAKTPAGSFGIDADLLAASGAGSVLLGGLRRLDPASSAAPVASWALDTRGTQTLSVDLGEQTLVLEELLLGASGQISLAPGTQINTRVSGKPATLGEREFKASGDGALAFFSRNPLALTRSGALLQGGNLSVGAGSRLSGEQLLLDATGALAVDASTALDAWALALGARALDIGAAAQPNEQATVLDGSLLATVRAAPVLQLRAYDGIRFAGRQDWAERGADGAATRVQTALVLDTPTISGVADAGGAAATVDLAAQSVMLRNSTGRAASGGAGGGQLRIDALPPLQFGSTGGLTLGPGALQLGFADAALRSGGDIVFSGSGETRAQGDLLLAAARITAAKGADQSVQASAGRLQLLQQAGSRTLGETVGLGASLSLSAKTLVQGAQIELAGGDLTLAASGSSTEAGPFLKLLEGSRVSVAGPTLDDGKGHQVHGRAGRIQLRADQGAIELLGELDLRAAAQGDAGELRISAVGNRGGLLLGNAARVQGDAGSASGDLGGRLSLDLASSSDAADLLGRASGFDREIELRVRSGDLNLNDRAIRAQRVNLSADAGKLSLANSRIDARAASGGVVSLSAGGDVQLGAGSTIDARSSRAGANGGDVLLASRDGRVRVDATAGIQAGGDSADDGRIVLRAQRGADGRSVAVDAFDSSRLQAGDVAVEAVRVYTQVGSGSSARAITAIASGNSVTNTGTLGQTAVRTDSNTYMANASAVLAGLGVAGDERVRLSAGVEVRASGDLRIASDWALNAERPGNEAGFLTLRAAGNLDVSGGSLSDGFTTATAAGLLNANAQSWSMRLVAGADLGAADLLTTRGSLATGIADTGNLTVAAGRIVRTGAGSIELAAARDLRFGAGSANTAGGAAYVAGRQLEGEAGILSSLFAGQSAKPKFSEQGGRLSLEAGRDVSAGAATQLINNWHWRSGLVDSADASRYARSSQLAWWNEFGQFRQTLASFGGGDLTVSAGRDLINVQAMLPSSGYADSAGIADASLRVLNGGELRLDAARDIVGGQYFAAVGSGRLSAGGAIRASNGLQAFLAMSDGADWRLQARGNLEMAAAINPSALSTPSSRNPVSGAHYRWGDEAAVRSSSLTGELALRSGYTQSTLNSLGLSASSDDGSYLMATAPRVALAALQGDLSLARALVLAPSSQGQLSVWAGGDLAITESVAMSDNADWPNARSPVGLTSGSIKTGLVALSLNGSGVFQGLHANDTEGSWLLAGGTLSMITGKTLSLAESTLLRAGDDIRNLRFSTQHTRVDEVTRIEAGGSLFAGTQDGLIEVFGPGALEIEAGRSIDLGASQGVRTSGNLRNAALPARGASVSLTSASTGQLDLAALASQYLSLDGGSPRAEGYRELLLAHVRDVLRSPELSYDQAWALFQTFPASAQAAFGRELLAREFGTVYLEAQAPSSEAYTAQLQAAFEGRKADLLAAIDAALAGSGSLLLPGNEELTDDALRSYRTQIEQLSFDRLDVSQIAKDRSASLAAVQTGWQENTAGSLGRTLQEIGRLRAANPADATVAAFDAALQDRSSARFDRYREQVLRQEIASSGTAGAQFGIGSLPARLALYDEGFRVAELAGAGNFASSAVWPGQAPLFAYEGNLNLTQSAVLTERGGDIALRNAGGAINVGLKDGGGTAGSVKGVIALGGGDVVGFSRDDFQVNTQRVFIVGQGDMTLWSSAGDIDSGRGANTAVAAPPLAARRSADGVVFEPQATTTGSGLGILEDVNGFRDGTVGLFAAQGEILALDALIRAPALVLGSTVKGADNLVAASVGGAAAPVTAPPVSVTPPAPSSTENRDTAALAGAQDAQQRQRSSLLTVDLLGLGPSEETCNAEERDEKGRCRRQDAPKK